MMTTMIDARFEDVRRIIEAHGADPARLIPILQEVQALYRYLPEEVLRLIALTLGVAPAKVFGVAAFYAHFRLAPLHPAPAPEVSLATA